MRQIKKRLTTFARSDGAENYAGDDESNHDYRDERSDRKVGLAMVIHAAFLNQSTAFGDYNFD